MTQRLWSILNQTTEAAPFKEAAPKKDASSNSQTPTVAAGKASETDENPDTDLADFTSDSDTEHGDSRQNSKPSSPEHPDVSSVFEKGDSIEQTFSAEQQAAENRRQGERSCSSPTGSDVYSLIFESPDEKDDGMDRRHTLSEEVDASRHQTTTISGKQHGEELPANVSDREGHTNEQTTRQPTAASIQRLSSNMVRANCQSRRM